MKIKDKEYNFSDLFKLAQSGLRFQKEPVLGDKDTIINKWIQDSDIRPGLFKNKSAALHGHYLEYCDKNNIDPKLRKTLNHFGQVLVKKFSYKKYAGTKMYEINKDLSAYEKKEAKKDNQTKS